LTGLPEIQRVVIVILENADLAQAQVQPYLSYLTRHGALLTNYHGFLGEYSGNPQTGQYERKHTPFMSYIDVTQDTQRCSGAIVNATGFDADVYTNNLPQLSFYIPNSYNDGHETSLAFADAWLRSRFDPLLSDPRFIVGTLFVVVFDEAVSTGPNMVYCSFHGAGVKPGVTSAEPFDHYSLLRTIEEIFHVGTLRQRDDTATPIAGIWR